tara:strand:+ start:99794 stop:100192 length:399 start_codon:yes stop_codon:yes gene_type:complete
MNVKKILLIDDSDIDNFINKSVLQKANIADEIIIETSAKDALTYLKNVMDDESNSFPDVIFLDIKMPVMDGFEFLDEYVHFPEHAKSKCIIFMLSSSIDPRDAERAKQVKEVKSYFTKPLTQNLINTVLNSL